MICLFRFFKLSINLTLPFGFGLRKILETNCPGQGLHAETVPDLRSLEIASLNSLDSLVDRVGGFGIANCCTGLLNIILYPLIQDNMVLSLVIIDHW